MKLDLPLLKIGPGQYLAMLSVRYKTDFRNLLAIHLEKRGEDKL